jgi:cation diffusion facilitator family transporter
MNDKIKTARLSVISNSFLLALKLAIGIISGSISIISEAIHTGLDLAAAVVAFFSVKVSDIPPDSKHPYGHGKYENVSGVIEAILILAASVWIIIEAIKRIINPEPIELPVYGIASMLVSSVVNFFVSRRLYKVARRTDSVALEADALHLKTDVYASAGVALGLLMIWITGFTVLDPVIAILVALLIIMEAYFLLRKAFNPLLDQSLPEKELLEIKGIIEKFCTLEISYHNLQTRKSGSFSHIDFHLYMPADKTIREAHDLCDLIEENIMEKIRNARVNIHVEYNKK